MKIVICDAICAAVIKFCDTAKAIDVTVLASVCRRITECLYNCAAIDAGCRLKKLAWVARLTFMTRGSATTGTSWMAITAKCRIDLILTSRAREVAASIDRFK